MPDVSGIGPILTLLGTFAGIWVVVFLFRWFQKDFVEQYRKELAEERARREAAEREADAERRARQHAEGRAERYRYKLLRRGIDPDEEEGVHHADQ